MTDKEKSINHYGGQALIEGVLMRGKKYVVAAIREPGGKIHVENEELGGIYKSRLSDIPFFRGLTVLWDSLSLGMKYLTLSANLQTEAEEEKIEGASLYITVFLSIALAIGIFFVIPSLLVELVKRAFDFPPILNNLIEGLIRLLMLVLYIWGIGKSKEIARVFSYHGAEHKTINAFEQGKEITLENIREFPLAHPRCGTSFLLTLMIISVLIFSLLGEMNLVGRVVSRILLVPFLAMISYEIIRWMGDHLENHIVKFLTKPNLLLQRLTTREPTNDMMEVSITSFKRLLELEGQNF